MRRSLVPALLGAMSGCTVMLEEHTDQATFAPDLTGVERLEVTNGSGSVVVAPGSEVRLMADISWRGGTPPDIDVSVVGDTLVIATDCDPLVLGGCNVDWELSLPAELLVDVDTGSGDVWVTDMLGRTIVDTGSGDVTFSGLASDATADTGSGDVKVTDHHGALTADTGSGDVSVEGATDVVVLSTGSGDVTGSSLCVARIDVSTGSGDVNLQACRAPETTVIDTGSGDVALEVPSDVYRIDTDTGSGDVVVNNLSIDDSADRTIDIDTGSGDILIVGR